MQISLNPDGPPMWFLGEPKNLIVSLSYLQPGPVEVDFFNLGDVEQQTLLAGLQHGEIIGDIAFPELYQEWAKSKEPKPADPEPEKKDEQPIAVVAPTQDQVFYEQIQERVSKRKQILESRQKKFDDRCAYLCSLSLSSLKAAVAGEKDSRMVHAMLKMEKLNKQRKSVIDLLLKKLKTIEDTRAKQIEQDTEDQIKKITKPGETRKYSVVSSDSETIILTPEDLIAAANAV